MCTHRVHERECVLYWQSIADVKNTMHVYKTDAQHTHASALHTDKPYLVSSTVLCRGEVQLGLRLFTMLRQVGHYRREGQEHTQAVAAS